MAESVSSTALNVYLFIGIYLAVMNLLGLFFMGYDKHQAKKGGFRISEATLFTTALLGGSIGSLLGMYLFRHKTKHWYFVFGMPLILILQIAAAWFIFYKLPINFKVM